MSQWEDMVRGALYQGEDPALVALRRESLRLCQAYNALDPDRAEERQKLLRRLLGQVGDNCTICPNFFCDYGSNIRVGENFFANYNCVILDTSPVYIGENAFIAPGVWPDTPWTRNSVGRALALPHPSPLAKMCGSGPTPPSAAE